MNNNNKTTNKPSVPWLGLALMGIGGGLSGQNFLSAWQQAQALQAEKEFRDWQRQQQDIENQINLLKLGFTPYSESGFQIPPEMLIELGGRKYGYYPFSQTQPVYITTPEGNLQRIGDVEKGAKIIPPSTFETPEQRQERQVETQVQKDVLGRLTKLQELIPVLDRFDTMLKATPVGKGFGGKVKGIGETISGKIGLDPFAASAIANAEAMRPQIARGFGDVGNLSEPEQKRAIQFVPLLTDPDDTKVIKTLSGYLFIRDKLISAVKRAKLENNEGYLQSLRELDKRINNKFLEATQIGIPVERIEKFSGIKIPRFKSEKEAKEAKLDKGSLILIKGRLAVWE